MAICVAGVEGTAIKGELHKIVFLTVCIRAASWPFMMTGSSFTHMNISINGVKYRKGFSISAVGITQIRRHYGICKMFFSILPVVYNHFIYHRFPSIFMHELLQIYVNEM